MVLWANRLPRRPPLRPCVHRTWPVTGTTARLPEPGTLGWYIFSTLWPPLSHVSHDGDLCLSLLTLPRTDLLLWYDCPDFVPEMGVPECRLVCHALSRHDSPPVNASRTARTNNTETGTLQVERSLSTAACAPRRHPISSSPLTPFPFYHLFFFSYTQHLFCI